MKLANRTGATLSTLLGGILSSLAVAVILGVIAAKLKLALYAFSLWYVLPIGAMFSGFVGGLGYSFGFRKFPYRPFRIIMPFMIAIAVSTYFGMHFIDYRLSEVGGRYVSTVIPFSRYIDLVVRHTKDMTIGSVGSLGYVFLVRDVTGFAIASFVIFYSIMSGAFCLKCDRLLRCIKKSAGYARTLSSLKEAYGPAVELLNCDNWAGAAHRVSTLGANSSDAVFSLRLELLQCTDCQSLYSDLVVTRLRPKKELDDYHVRRILLQPTLD